MTNFANWMPSSMMQPLGWALVHFLWQGLAVAALVSVAMALSRSARTRYAIAVAALVLMVAAPIGTFFYLWNSESAATAAANSAAAVAGKRIQSDVLHAGMPVAARPAIAAMNQEIATANANLPPGALLWFVEVWFAGVIFFSLRYAGGMLLIERLRSKESKPVGALLLEKCHELQRRLGLDRVIRYCECHRIEAPAVIGWFRPVVLLPAAVLTGLTEEQLTAVIAHELAHIQRSGQFRESVSGGGGNPAFLPSRDLVGQPAHPRRAGELLRRRGDLCKRRRVGVRAGADVDGRAARGSFAGDGIQSKSTGGTSDAVTGSGKFSRRNPHRGICRQLSSVWQARCLRAMRFFSNANNSLGPVDTGKLSQEMRAAPATTSASTQAKAAVSSFVRSMAQATTQTMVHASVSAIVAESHAPTSSLEGQEVAAQQDAATATQAQKESYIDSLKAAGLQNLTVDEIVELKIQGVTADYVRQMQALNLKIAADELVAMKVQGITPDYVKAVRDMGFKVDSDDLVALKVQSITPEYVRAMRASGLDGDADEFIAMKVQGITPEYAKTIRDLGWKVSEDDLIALKVQGITPEYVREMRASGLDGDADEFIAMKIQGVTPEYAKEAHELGLKANTDDLVAMRVQHVTPEYVRAIRATGINPEGDEFIALKVQGVTPEYVKALQAAGLKDLKADDVIAAKVQGITPEFIEEAHKHGFKDLDLEKLLALKRADVF